MSNPVAWQLGPGAESANFFLDTFKITHNSITLTSTLRYSYVNLEMGAQRLKSFRIWIAYYISYRSFYGESRTLRTNKTAESTLNWWPVTSIFNFFFLFLSFFFFFFLLVPIVLYWFLLCFPIAWTNDRSFGGRILVDYRKTLDFFPPSPLYVIHTCLGFWRGVEWGKKGSLFDYIYFYMAPRFPHIA